VSCLVPAKGAVQHVARIPKPGGIEELFTGNLETDKKIKQIHKVHSKGQDLSMSMNAIVIILETTANQRSERTISKWR
jgi:hypothetical protein